MAARKVVDLLAGRCGPVVSGVALLRRQAREASGVPTNRLPANRTKEAKRAAVEVKWHFQRMGFERLGRTPVYALPMSPAAVDGSGTSDPGATLFRDRYGGRSR